MRTLMVLFVGFVTCFGGYESLSQVKSGGKFRYYLYYGDFATQKAILYEDSTFQMSLVREGSKIISLYLGKWNRIKDSVELVFKDHKNFKFSDIVKSIKYDFDRTDYQKDTCSVMVLDRDSNAVEYFETLMFKSGVYYTYSCYHPNTSSFQLHYRDSTDHYIAETDSSGLLKMNKMHMDSLNLLSISLLLGHPYTIPIDKLPQKITIQLRLTRGYFNIMRPPILFETSSPVRFKFSEDSLTNGDFVIKRKW